MTYLQTDYIVEDSECASTHAELSLGAEKNAGLLGQKYDMIKPVSEALTPHYQVDEHPCQTARSLRMDGSIGKVLKGIHTN